MSKKYMHFIMDSMIGIDLHMGDLVHLDKKTPCHVWLMARDESLIGASDNARLGDRVAVF